MSADGILVVDKPQGRTSRAITTAVGRLFQEKRAGHLGTLDPLATGVLPVMLGQATGWRASSKARPRNTGR